MTALTQIQQSGFELSITGTGKLEVSPASKLTDTQREFIKQHKVELICELEAANDTTHKTLSIGFEPLKTAIIRACHARGDPRSLIIELIEECKTDCPPEEWPGLIQYFKTIEQRHIPAKGTCKTCQNWTPDKIGNGTGLGRCGIDPKFMAWPGASCRKWQLSI